MADERTDEQLKQESLDAALEMLQNKDNAMYYLALGKLAALSMLIHERTRTDTWTLS